jgi:hypothetical protein
MAEAWTQERLEKALHDTAQKLHEVEEKSAERIRIIELGAAELMSLVKAEKAARIEAEKRLTDYDNDARVIERVYCDEGAAKSAPRVARSLAEVGHIHHKDGRQGAAVQAVEGVGVVRWYGSEEDGRFVPGLLDDKPRTEWQGELQEIVEQRSLARAVCKGKTPKYDAQLSKHLRRGPGKIGKMFADNSGEGSVFIPDITLPVMQRNLEMMRQTEALFQRRQVSGGNTAIPFLTRGVQPFVSGAPDTNDLNPGELRKSQAAFTQIQAEPVTLSIAVPIHQDAEEDAIMNAMSMLQTLIAEGHRDGVEDAIWNADDAGTHQDAIASWNPRSRWGILGAANDHRTAWTGLRALAFDKSNAAAGNADQTAKGWLADLKNVDVAVAFDDTVLACTPQYYLSQLITDSDLLTVDKIGAAATLITGQVGSIGGHRVVLSEFLTADLAASGLYTGSGATGSRLIVARNRFEMVERRGLRMDVEISRLKGVTYLIASQRVRFRSLDQAATKNVRCQYNLTTT